MRTSSQSHRDEANITVDRKFTDNLNTLLPLSIYTLAGGS